MNKQECIEFAMGEIGLEKELNEVNLKDAYRKKAMGFHPDKPNGNEEDFKLLNEVNIFLRNELNGASSFKGEDPFKNFTRNPTVRARERQEQSVKIIWPWDIWTAATIGWMNVWINAYGGFYSRAGKGSGGAGQRGGGVGGKAV